MYKKLTIIFKNDPNSMDDFDGTYSVNYEKASFQVSGDNFILHLQKEEKNGDSYVEGHIFPLKMIKNYKGF
jgi:hypothetical protein